MPGQTITRADLVDKLIENNNFTRQQAAEILEKILEEIEKALVQGDQVKISAFGTFSILTKKERMGRNPRTGKDARISPRQVISFRASPLFKKSV